MRRLLRRLATTSPGEARFRAAEGVWRATEAVRFAYDRGEWHPERLRLTSQSASLVQACEALARGDRSGADAALRSHFLQRQRRFVIDPAGRAAFAAAARALFPSCVADAVRRADPLLEGRYDLLGYAGLSFRAGTTPVDWALDPVHGRRAPARFWARVRYLDPACGDHKIIWELNRHQHWLTLGRAAWLTGDPRYAAAFVVELESWLRANPPLTGINWSSMLELAFRSLSWIWALHLFLSFDTEPERLWLLDLLAGLERQLEHVSHHLSFYFSPNTHLLGEGLALYVAGRVLPELKAAARWERIGRGILIREMHAQVRADGGHAELSLHYHRYALDFYLLALAVARETGDDAADSFAEVVSRLASFCRAVADDAGRLATIGDDDGGLLFPMCGRQPADARDSLCIAAALLGRPEWAVDGPPEEVLWMVGGDAALLVHPCAAEPRCELFPVSGYAVLRSAHAHAILDAGPHGFLNAGHAHADALALVLSVEGRPLLIDPGTATYTDRELRDRFRSTAMHNTAVVDRRPQSEPAGPFHWASRAEARVVLWRPAPRDGSARQIESASRTSAPAAAPGTAIDYVEAEHDGYRPLVHRRGVLSTGDGLWLVADHILGSGHHPVDLSWHLDPMWMIEEQGDRFRHPDGLHAAIAATARERQAFRGDAGGLGWCAPIYGRMVPSPTLRFSETADAPLSIVTAIGASTVPVRLSVEALPVTVDQEDGWHRAAAAISLDDITLLAMFATPQTGEPSLAARPSFQHVSIGGARFTTDGRVALLRWSQSGGPDALDLIDGTVAIWEGLHPFSLPSTAAAADLHLDRAELRQLSRHARPVG